MKKDLKEKGYQVTSPGMTPSGIEERTSLKRNRANRYRMDNEGSVNIEAIETEVEVKDVPIELLRR